MSVLCATLGVLGSFFVLQTATAVFSAALLACTALVVNAVVAEWTRFDFAERLFSDGATASVIPPAVTEPVALRIVRVADPDEDTLPHAA